MRIQEITEENFTSEIYKQYIGFRESIYDAHCKNKGVFLIEPQLYRLSNIRIRKKGFEWTRQTHFGELTEGSLLGKNRYYFIYEPQKNELAAIVSFFPSGGDELEKSWVELATVFRLLPRKSQSLIEDLLLRTENMYLSSHRKTHGVPVARIRTQLDPKSRLLNPHLSTGFQITATIHAYQILIASLKKQQIRQKSSTILLKTSRELEFSPEVEADCAKMVNRLIRLINEIDGADLKESVVIDRLIGQIKLILQDEETYVGGGRFLLFQDPEDPIPAGLAVLMPLIEDTFTLESFFVVGPQRVERVIGSLLSITNFIEDELSSDTKLMIRTSARDIELTSTLESLEFNLGGIVYDLRKDGPDKEKILFDSYADDILGLG